MQEPLDLIGPIAQLTSIGFSIWYGWYVTTKSIPKIIEQHAMQVADLGQKHERVVERLAEQYRNDINECRAHFERAIDRIFKTTQPTGRP